MQMQVNISIYLNKYTFHDLLATDANFARVVRGKRKGSKRVNDLQLSISDYCSARACLCREWILCKP